MSGGYFESDSFRVICDVKEVNFLLEFSEIFK